jgi:hypothetical protein
MQGQSLLYYFKNLRGKQTAQILQQKLIPYKIIKSVYLQAFICSIFHQRNQFENETIHENLYLYRNKLFFVLIYFEQLSNI